MSKEMSRVERKQRERKAKMVKKVVVGTSVLAIGGLATVGCTKKEQAVNENISKNVLADAKDTNVKAPEKKTVVETKKEAVYKYISGDNIPAYSMADAPEGFSPVPYVSFGLNDVVEVLNTKGNSTKIKYNGFKVWVASKFLSDERISEPIALETKCNHKVDTSISQKGTTSKKEVISETHTVKKEEPSKEEVKVNTTVVKKDETTKEEVKVEAPVVEKVETTKEEVKVPAAVVEKDETTKEEVKVEAPVVEKDETTKEEVKVPADDEKVPVKGTCGKEDREDHDEYTCIEGAELVEGDCDELTRNVTATNIHGQEALLIRKGQKVSIGQSRGNGKISVLGKNVHGNELELVIREDALKSLQVEHTDDCDVCVPSYAFGRFGNAYANALGDITLYPNACNDIGGFKIKDGQKLYVVDDLLTDNGRIPVSFDEDFDTFYWAERDSLDCDKRGTEIMYLMDKDAMTFSTIKSMVGTGYGFEENTKVTIPAFSSVKIWKDSFDGSTVVVSYQEVRLSVPVEDAIAAGIYE